VQDIMYYAINSKVVYSNYNYYINNNLPSIILNINDENVILKTLDNKEAFDIINENRNTIMYNFTFTNILDFIHIKYSKKRLIKPIDILEKDVLNNNPYLTLKDDEGVLTSFQ